LARRKTVTRGQWKETYAPRFHAGDILYLQRTCDIPIEDWAAEGLAYLHEHDLPIDGVPATIFWRRWLHNYTSVWVIRFEIVSIP
jgi:hypothetical protein